MEEIHKLLIETLATKWFPDEWLSSELLFLPAEEQIINAFQTRSASDIQLNYISCRKAEQDCQIHQLYIKILFISISSSNAALFKISCESNMLIRRMEKVVGRASEDNKN